MGIYYYFKKNMANASKNKSEERKHFELFEMLCNDLPPIDRLEHDDKPDFLIEHSEEILGIEHTQLFKVTKHPSKGCAPQEIEVFMQHIVDSARKYCEEDIPPLYVNVYFNSHQIVPKNRASEIKRISQLLAEIVKKWHYDNPSKRYQILELESTSEISTIISHISITRYHHHHWTAEGAASVQNITVGIIQSCIDKKNPLYEKYLKKCDECWLLIVVDVFKNSQSFEIGGEISNNKFESKFERIYFMDASHRRTLWKLPITRM
jgi:hypothetical protein